MCVEVSVYQRFYNGLKYILNSQLTMFSVYVYNCDYFGVTAMTVTNKNDINTEEHMASSKPQIVALRLLSIKLFVWMNIAPVRLFHII